MNLNDEEFILTINPLAFRCDGLPHPLFKFAKKSTTVLDNSYSLAILRFMNEDLEEAPDSQAYQSAFWFLMESERAFAFACEKSNIDGAKLRSHLRKVINGLQIN